MKWPEPSSTIRFTCYTWRPSRNITELTYLPYEVFGEVAKVIRPRYIRVTEQVLIWVLWFITVPKEQLEEVEQSDPI